MEMYDVFISYVLGNEGIVRRIYEDLTRSGLTVWEFQTCVKFDVHFIKEFQYQILNSKVFCLIDSNESRKGEYVRMEMAYARKHNKNITICRIEEIITEPPFFEEQDYIIRFNLWEAKYKSSVKYLCSHLGKEYVPAFSDPIDDDFLQEMSDIKMKQRDMEPDTWKNLYRKYEEFREEVNIESAETKLKALLMDSKKLNIPLLTPYLVLGNLYAEQKRHVHAKEIYKEASKYFVSDPRTYAGLGGACFFLFEFRESVDAYLICFDLLMKTNEQKHGEHIVMIAHNLLQSMLEGSIQADFINRINQIPANDLHTPRLEALKGKYYLYHKNYEEAIKYYEKSYSRLIAQATNMMAGDAIYMAILILDLATACGCINKLTLRKKVLNEGINLIENTWKHIGDSALQQLLPEMIRLLGETFLNGERNEQSAIICYEKAAMTGNNIKYYAELALVLFKLSSPRLQDVLNKTEQLRPKRVNSTKEECYYTGLYYFLQGKSELAQEYYNDSDMHDWPFYNDLI